MRRMTVLFLLACALGCGGSGGGGNGGNHPPVCAPSASPAPVVMGQSTALDARATDQDGDPLTYSWAQTAPATPQGSFSSQTSATSTWTAPTVAQTTLFTLAVTVSDAKGGTTTCAAKVYGKTSTDPSFIADVQPLVVKCFGACHTRDDGVQPLADYATMLTYHTLVECPGHVLVKPGDPDNSAHLQTMVGTCRNQMPLGGPYLGSDQINLVRTWILQGAANN